MPPEVLTQHEVRALVARVREQAEAKIWAALLDLTTEEQRSSEVSWTSFSTSRRTPSP